MTDERREHERRRLAALHEYRLLDEPADDELEAVIRVAAAVAGVPTATLNLIDENRQCQLTTVGFEGADSPRDESMCAVVFESGTFTHVPDAREDPLFAANPWVNGILADVRLYASAPLVSPSGYAVGSLCVFDDTPRRLTDEQIARLDDLAKVVIALFERRRQARELSETVVELARSNTELEQFAAVAGHDLVAPLGVVGGYAELLRDEYSDCLDGRANTWLGHMTQAVGRMRALIQALLAYARAGGADCRRAPTDADQVVQHALSDLQAAINEANAAVTVGPLPKVDADPTLLRQLLQNLIGNAVKYRHPDRRCHVTVSATPTPEGIEFAIADNGPGIPVEHRSRIFAMFATVTPGTRTGHGIGLATCQRIVHRHGGRIWASESPGGGATINFVLPS